MMLMPRRNDFDLITDLFDDPFFKPREDKVMRTDIKEHENSYEINIDLPGFDKENIEISVESGYLIVRANINKEERNDDNGKYIHRERYIGECSRSFYIGDNLESEDVKARFKNGILYLTVPKKENKEEIPEKKFVQID